ncbi:hypothetical protein HAALTHF_52540n [Vreelandella aquamarina]|nr:hypothetical protein HAALTHF_52540n [Halomonas axialensis]
MSQPDPTLLEEISQLRADLDDANYRYYVLDEPTLTDADYDRKLQRLKQLEGEHPELISPTRPLSESAPLRQRAFRGCPCHSDALAG